MSKRYSLFIVAQENCTKIFVENNTNQLIIMEIIYFFK